MKWDVYHKECGTLGNLVNVYFAASGFVRFSLYCFFCATTFDHDTSLEDIVVECNDHDRIKRAQQTIEERRENGDSDFDLSKWEPDENEN